MRGADRSSVNRRLTWKLAIFTAGSFAFGFALVPLYGLLCNLTGAGNPGVLVQASSRPDAAVDTQRQVTVELLATLPTVGNWEFRPLVGALQVHPGRLYEAEFYARNLTGHDTVAQAIPDIAPARATVWFHKTDCFCFTPQSFRAGEARALKVRFFVDRDLPTYIDRLTLSYTFYDGVSRVATR
ncbi:MAG: cytochrome c oxidase assembly protein [Gammaproteobacteria bacterium]|nr:cytochrome c oxidase assembly protein [Gammaproteobacteria bacterium]